MAPRDQVDAVRAHINAVLPPPSEWNTPSGYPNSLAMCIIDSVWSVGVKYKRHVIPVLNAYRRLRGPEVANSDSPRNLVDAVTTSGGPAEFAEALGNHQRTSTRNGILKADAVFRAAHLFVSAGVVTADQLVPHTADDSELANAWRAIKGQGSGITWTYMLLLAKIDGIKPDRMIHRFITTATNTSVTNAEAIELLTAVRNELPHPRPDLLTLDHAIWDYQRQKKA